jgi:hypothetical protein
MVGFPLLAFSSMLGAVGTSVAWMSGVYVRAKEADT